MTPNAPVQEILIDREPATSGTNAAATASATNTTTAGKLSSFNSYLLEFSYNVNTLLTVNFFNCSGAGGISNTSPVFSAKQPAAGGLGSPLYPALNTTQIKDMIQGMTSVVGSAMRQMPLVTDPSGGLNGGGSMATPVGATGDSMNFGTSIPVLDERCTTTLNQLLAMGFSNQDGWLSRLIVAKKGDLEAVLNSLFPTGSK